MYFKHINGDFIMLDPSLIAAYQQTNYCFGNRALNVDTVSSDAQALLQRFSPKGGIFITAWNPLGEVKSNEENQIANLMLKDELNKLGLTIIDGYGESPDGKWHEDSFFAYPIDEKTSYQLCQKYQQNAVVYVDDNGLAKLLFLEKD